MPRGGVTVRSQVDLDPDLHISTFRANYVFRAELSIWFMKLPSKAFGFFDSGFKARRTVVNMLALTKSCTLVAIEKRTGIASVTRSLALQESQLYG